MLSKNYKDYYFNAIDYGDGPMAFITPINDPEFDNQIFAIHPTDDGPLIPPGWFEGSSCCIEPDNPMTLEEVKSEMLKLGFIPNPNSWNE